ncbi:DUF2837 family protein [bacterium]|nr:DUF2837 family protein [bacterium]
MNEGASAAQVVHFLGLSLPAQILKPMLLAGALLMLMSITDTLAYCVRTAGVLTRRLAISLSLFNSVVVFSRMANMIQTPVLGNFSDQVDKGVYDAGQVLTALRIDLLFVALGVLIGAALSPTYISLVRRGIDVLESKGSLPRTVWYGLRRCWRIAHYMRPPIPAGIGQHFRVAGLPRNAIVFNIFVTCFYSIGVMSTVLAASWDHSLAGTATNLSGVVNGIATVLFFVLVDPPAAIVIDQCINGKRPESDAKALHVMLVVTRFAGILIGIVLLPLMAKYVLTVAHWVNAFLSK